MDLRIADLFSWIPSVIHYIGSIKLTAVLGFIGVVVLTWILFFIAGKLMLHIHKIMDNLEGYKEYKKKCKEEYPEPVLSQSKIEDIFKEPIVDLEVPEERQEELPTTFIKRDKRRFNKGRPGERSYSQREKYPELFKEMEDLVIELIDTYGTSKISEVTGINMTTLHEIKRREKKLVKIARRYIPKLKKAKRILTTKEEDKEVERLDTKIEKAINTRFDLATSEEIHAMGNLAREILNYMTQTELSLRMNLPQSTMSYIVNEKIVRKEPVERYTKQLQSIKNRVVLDLNK